MKNKHLFSLVFCLLTLLVSLFNMVGMAIDGFFYNLKDLPTGQPLYSSMSPDGKTTLKLYKVELNGVGSAIRGELITADKTENVYWEVGAKSAISTWTSNNNMIINDHFVSKNGDKYDSRRQIELPEASAKSRLNKTDRQNPKNKPAD